MGNSHEQLFNIRRNVLKSYWFMIYSSLNIDNEIEEVFFVLIVLIAWGKNEEVVKNAAANPDTDIHSIIHINVSYKVCALPFINCYTISSYSYDIPTLTR